MPEKTAAELQQELLEAKAQIADLKPEVAPKKKPYSKEEIKAFKKDGHIIGKPEQKLSEGHDEEDLKKWDMWLVELELMDGRVVPEVGEKWSFPISITVYKKEKSGMVGNNKDFQWKNKATNFRERAADKRIFLHFPQGTVESGKKYGAGYFMNRTGAGVNAKDEMIIVVYDFPQATGAPVEKNKWGQANIYS